MSNLFPTTDSRISRALHLEGRALEAQRRWPESPKLADRLWKAARYQRRRASEICA